MKSRVHPAIAVVAIAIVLVGAGFFLAKAFNAGTVGKTYAPGEVPYVNKDLDTVSEAATQRDAVRTGDPDGK